MRLFLAKPKGLLTRDRAGLTEGGQPLRNVVLPAELMSQFIAMAWDNTERGIETCGLLMGTLVRSVCVEAGP